MSQENVEIVRRVHEEVVARPEPPRELFAPDFEFDVREPSPDFGVLRGVDAALEALGEDWDTFEEFHSAIEEVIHADREQVVVEVSDRGRVKGSDSEISNRFFQVWTFAEGKIVRLAVHTDRNRALDAAGLSE